MATPSNKRHKDVYVGLPRVSRQSIASLPELEEVPPSSVSCVPSSSKKVRGSPFLAPDSTGKSGSSAFPIAETPTRGPSKLRGRPLISTTAMESVADVPHPPPPLAASKQPKASNSLLSSAHWPLQVHETPSKICSTYQTEQSEDAIINATPVKAQPAAKKPTENSPQAVLSSLLQGVEESIYTALGWDDDVDELL